MKKFFIGLSLLASISVFADISVEVTAEGSNQSIKTNLENNNILEDIGTVDKFHINTFLIKDDIDLMKCLYPSDYEVIVTLERGYESPKSGLNVLFNGVEKNIQVGEAIVIPTSGLSTPLFMKPTLKKPYNIFHLLAEQVLGNDINDEADKAEITITVTNPKCNETYSFKGIRLRGHSNFSEAFGIH